MTNLNAFLYFFVKTILIQKCKHTRIETVLPSMYLPFQALANYTNMNDLINNKHTEML